MTIDFSPGRYKVFFKDIITTETTRFRHSVLNDRDPPDIKTRIVNKCIAYYVLR